MYIIDEAARNDFRNAMLEKRRKVVRSLFGVAGRSIAERKDIESACYTVYKAKVPFRYRGENAQTYVEPYPAALDFLVDKIFNFFNSTTPNTPNTEENFDKFHAELCEGFLKEANVDRRSKGLSDDLLTYGNAQKLVNMTFKYLTTFEDYPVFSDLFEHCHMPIDAFVLYYFAKHDIVPECKGGINLDKKNNNASPWAKYRKTSWTNLDNDEAEKKYNNLVIEYRNALRSLYPGFTMLHLEYYIWASVGAFCRRCEEDGHVAGICERIAPVPGATLPGTKTHFYM